MKEKLNRKRKTFLNERKIKQLMKEKMDEDEEEEKAGNDKYT